MKSNRIARATFVHACSAVLGLMLGSVAFAQTNLITNGDFSSNTGNGSLPTGWTRDFNSYGALGSVGGTMVPRTASSMLHAGNSSGTGGEYQDIATTSGRSYLVTLWLQGWADSAVGYDALMRQQGALVVGGTGSSAVALGNAQLASGTATLAFSNATVTNFLTQGRIAGVTTNSPWYAQASSFAASGSTTRIGLYNVSVAPFSSAVNVDDVGVYAANDWATNANASWSTSSNWADGAAPNAAGAIAAFSGTATAPRTITVDTGVTLGALIFRNANAYTLSGANALTLSGTYAAATGPVVTVNSGSHTIATPVAVSGTLAPTFAIDQNTRLTVSGNVSGSAGLVKSGYGSLVLSGSSGYTGVTNITNGMVQFGNKAALYGGGTASWTPANITVGASGVLGLNVGGAGEFDATDVGTILTNLGSVNNNGLRAGSSIALDTSNTGTFTYASAIINSTGTGGGAIGVTKLGSGVLALTGTNTYTGATTVNAGVLQLGDGGTTGAISSSSAMTVAAGGTLAFNRSDNYGGNFTNAIGGAGGVTIRQGALTLSGSSTFSGTTRIAGGSLTIANANALRNSTLDLNTADSGTIAAINQNSTLGGLAGSRNLDMGGRSLSIGGNNQSTTYSGALSNGVLTKSGIGALTLSGSNTLTGTYTHQAGQTVLSRSGGPSLFATGSAGTIVITNTVGGGSFSGYYSALVMGASNQLGTNVDLTMQQQNIWLGLTYFDLRGTETTIGNLSAPIAYTGATSWAIIQNNEPGFSAPGRLTVNQTVSGTFVGEFRDDKGGVGLTKNGSATLTLTSAGGAGISYTGTTFLNAGTLRLADATNFRSNTVIAGGATLEIANSSTQTISAVLSGSGSVLKTAAGTLTLSASNTYAGNTRINAGALSITNASALLNSTVDLNTLDSGTISFSQDSTLGGLMGSRNLDIGGRSLSIGNNGQSTTYSGTLSNGGLTKIGAGTLALTAANTYAGGTQLQAGTLRAGATSAFGSGAITLTSSATLDLDSLAVANAITSNGGTILNAANFTGTMTLVSGTTSLAGVGGTVDIDASAVANLSGAIDANVTVRAGGRGIAIGQIKKNVAVNGGAQFDILNDATIDEAASFTFANNGQIHIDRTNNLTLSKVISGTGGLRKGGSSRVTLTGTNTFSGVTQIDAGALIVNGSLAGDVAVAEGATLGGSGRLGDMLSGAGTISVGNSPGIGTAASVDPAAGTDWVFEITGTAPIWNSGTSASTNDVLRLTDTTPFLSNMGSANVVDVLFDLGVTPIAQGSYLGGFFVDDAFFDLAAALQNGQFRYWVAGEYGDVGQRQEFNVGTEGALVWYSLLAAYDSSLSASYTITQQTVDFGSGPISGSVTQFVVVPEPGTAMFAGVGIAMAGWSLWKRRRAA